MTPRRLYLALSVLGFVVPQLAFWPWFVEHGFAVRLFFEHMFANGISTFFSLDVLVAAVVVIAFVLIEGRRLRVPRLWLPIAGVVLVGVSFGLPVFLYQR